MVNVNTLAISLALCLGLVAQSPATPQGAVDQHWRDDMERENIMAATVEIHFNWNRRPKNLKVMRTMFFSKKDGPDSQVTDPARLRSLRESGLERDVDEEALKRTREGGWFLEPPRKPVKYAAAYVHLAVEEPSSRNPQLFRTYDPHSTELEDAAFVGDAAAIRQALVAGVPRSEATQALGLAVEGESMLVLRMLLDSGADVNASDKAGETPLTVAAKLGKTAVLKMLLDSRADVNAPGEGGETPLMVAARFGKTANVEFLLAAGADVNVRTPGGETALLLAQAYHHREIADLLERTGAKSR